ncbi:MAG: DUF7507 domain-containing protein, partial [Cellulomonadaceae bacterium]
MAATLAFSGLFIAAPAAYAVTPIAGAEFENVSSTPATVQTTLADQCNDRVHVGSAQACGDPIALNYGAGDQIALTEFTVDGHAYKVLPTSTGQTWVDILRVDNPEVQGVRDTVFQANPADENPASNSAQRFNLVGNDMTNRTMSDVLGTNFVTEGTDNTFANYNGPTVNNVERVSIMNRTPMLAEEPGRLGIAIAERGGNDSFKIAAVTAVDAAGNPTAWGPVVEVSSSAWGTLLPDVTSTVLLKDQGVDSTYRPTDWTNSQRIAGVYVSFDELGVEPFQQVFGVSLAAGDETTMEGPWNLGTPYDGVGGLDMVSGVFASSVAPGLTLTKTSDPADGSTVTGGDRITYTVKAQNVGNTVLDPVVVKDDLSGVLEFAEYQGDVATQINGVDQTTGAATIVDGELAWTGSLDPFAVVTLTYSVIVDDGVSGKTIENRATASGTPPGLPEITPPPVETTHPVVDSGFEITKSADPVSGTTVLPGEKITYTVTGTNTGETVLNPAKISDDLSGVLGHAAYNDDVAASTGTVSVSGTDLVWTGTLSPDQKVTITYSVTVNADAAGVVLNNVVSATATPQLPADPSDPNSPTQPGTPIVPPNVETSHPVPDPGFVITKSADPVSGTTVLPGEKITYTVTGTNTGDTVLDPAKLSDDLSGVFAHAGYNGDVSASTGEVSVDGTVLAWSGSLGVEESVTITYSVTVNADAKGVVLNNVVTGVATPQVPVDPTDPEGPSKPGEPITPPSAETSHPVPDPGFVVTKSADPVSGTTVLPGEKITYTVTGVNTGDTVLDPAKLSDDLSG